MFYLASSEGSTLFNSLLLYGFLSNANIPSHTGGRKMYRRMNMLSLLNAFCRFKDTMMKPMNAAMFTMNPSTGIGDSNAGIPMRMRYSHPLYPASSKTIHML